MTSEIELGITTERVRRIGVNLNKTKTDGVRVGLSDLGQHQRHRNWGPNRRTQSTREEFCFGSSGINTVILVNLKIAVSPIASAVGVVRARRFQVKFRIQRFAPGITTWLCNYQIDVASLRREVTQRMSFQSTVYVVYQNG